jgi:hypothetical protein
MEAICRAVGWNCWPEVCACGASGRAASARVEGAAKVVCAGPVAVIARQINNRRQNCRTEFVKAPL